MVVVNGVHCWFKNSEHMMKFGSYQRSTLVHVNFIMCVQQQSNGACMTRWVCPSPPPFSKQQRGGGGGLGERHPGNPLASEIPSGASLPRANLPPAPKLSLTVILSDEIFEYVPGTWRYRSQPNSSINYLRWGAILL